MTAVAPQSTKCNPDSFSGSVELTKQAWAQAMQPFFNTKFSGPIDDSSAPWIEAWRLTLGVFSLRFAHNVRCVRDAAHRQQYKQATLLVSAHETGSVEGCINTKKVQAGAFEIHIRDLSTEFDLTLSNNRGLHLFLLHEDVGFLPGQSPTSLVLGPSNPMAAFMFAGMEHLLHAVRTSDFQSGLIIQQGLIETIANLVQPRSEENDAADSAEMRIEIEGFIRRNVSDPDFGVDHICETYSISRSALYRLFRKGDGIAKRILRHRMRKGFFFLSAEADSDSRRRIGHAAEYAGFTDTNRFSRAFKSYFGFPPSAVEPARKVELNFSPEKSHIKKAEIDRISVWCAEFNHWMEREFKSMNR